MISDEVFEEVEELIESDPEESFASEEEISEAAEQTSDSDDGSSEEESTEVIEEEETSEETEEGESLEEVQSENDSYTVIDYTSYLENIQNSLNVHSLILIGLVFVLGLLMGLRKL